MRTLCNGPKDCERLKRMADTFGLRAYPSTCNRGIFVDPGFPGSTAVYVRSPVELFRAAARVENGISPPLEALYL